MRQPDSVYKQRFLDKNPDYQRGYMLRHRYGISLSDYNAMVDARGGLCEICGRPPVGKAGKSRLQVDHCHKEDRVRGLLCAYCNVLVGSLESPLRPAVEAYLARTSADKTVLGLPPGDRRACRKRLK